MKLTIERAALFRALGHVQSVVERRNTIPILSNVLLRAEGGRLHLTATDMDLEIVEATPAIVETAGATTAPAHTLYDIVRKLPEGAQVEISLNPNGKALSLRAGRSRFQLGCLDVADFPSMTGGDMPSTFVLPARGLRNLIDRTRFAISTEETRYYLNGIYLHVGEFDGAPGLRAVATDGHRLARVQSTLPAGADGMPSVIVPRKTVLELRKLIEEAADPIQIALSETKVRFSFDHVVLTSKLIDGTFPDYERVIPQGNDKMMEVDTKSFAAAVDRVATIATEKTRAVKLAITSGQLTLSATSTDQGSATEELEVDYGSDALEIGFNSRYLLDIAGQIDSDRARFYMADGGSPTVIRDGGGENGAEARAEGDDADETDIGPIDEAIYVLMPMRV